MTTETPKLKQMAINILMGKQGRALKPSEIASIIIEKYPVYCEQKILSSTQTDLDLPKQIANQISAAGKQWLDQEPQLKSSDETPRTYWWEIPEMSEIDLAPISVQEIASSNVETHTEQNLYPKLAIYLWNMKSRKVYPKRIDEKKSSNTYGRNGNKSLHPDMVAMEDLMPHSLWSSEIKGWAANAGAPQSKFWSFEVKIKINSVSDARECYFQALANSAWAHFGYLVATQFSDKAYHELKILHDLHGIGLILLDVENPADDTIIKLPARERDHVDWGSCNRIASQNSDFKKFIELVSDFHLTKNTRDSDWYIPTLQL